MKQTNKQFYGYLPYAGLITTAWFLLIFALSSQPTLTSSQPWMLITPIRKSAHVIEFAILTGLVWIALSRAETISLRFRKLSPYHTQIAFLLPLLYAIFDETHQYFVPNRKAQITDVAVDVTGIVLAMTLIWLWHRRKVLVYRYVKLHP